MKTLVLAVDRDNDYGEKANVPTPVIGLDDCLNAAMMLGIADPEDSDVNGLLAAIQTYKEIMEDSRGVKGREAEIALICGDRKVGHRSDYAVIDQLDEVLEKVRPDRVILVGDGAEDEYIYPVITSRVQVDSVRKDPSSYMVDVRTPEEFARGHIEGSVNIPVDDLRDRLDEIPRDRHIRLICQSALRSYIAARILEQRGYECSHLAGGYRLYASVMRDTPGTADAMPCGVRR